MGILTNFTYNIQGLFLCTFNNYDIFEIRYKCKGVKPVISQRMIHRITPYLGHQVRGILAMCENEGSNIADINNACLTKQILIFKLFDFWIKI